MAQTTLRKLQIFRNDGTPLMLAPEVIKSRIEEALGTSITLLDGEFIDIRYFKGHHEGNTWKVLTVQSNKEIYLEPTSENIAAIKQYGVITGLVGVGVSYDKTQGEIGASHTATSIQWIEGGEGNTNVETGSQDSDVIKIGVTENPEGNFIVTGTISLANLASRLQFDGPVEDNGKLKYTLQGTDNGSTWNNLASFDIEKESFVESGEVVYSLKADATEVSGWAASWDSKYKVLNNTRLLWYSGNPGNLASQEAFIKYGETNNRGEWLLKLTIKSNGVTTYTTEDIYIPLPDLTYLVSGNVNLLTDKLNLVHDNGTTVEINIAALHNINVINGDHFGSETTDTSTGSGDFIRVKATTTTDSSTGEKSTTLTSETKNSTVSAGNNDTLSATDGLLTNAAVATIENYIDNYDCGTFTLNS